VYDRDAGRYRIVGARNLKSLPSEPNGTRIGTMDPGREVDQRALPRPIFADQSDNFSGMDFEVDAREGADATERFGDRLEFEQSF
jgi:hypothetical protein